MADLARRAKGIARLHVGIASAVSRYATALEERRHRRLLMAIAAAGFVLRLSTILWGIPLLPYVGTYHPDERTTYEHALYFPGNYGVDTNFIHGATVPYLIAAVLTPVRAVITFEHWELVCRLGMRFLSVLAGAVSILLIYHLGRRIYDETTALLAAGFTAASFTHTLNSAFATQDVIVGFLILACFLTLTRAANLGQLIASGALLGVLLGTKISSVSILVAMPALAAVEIWNARSREKSVLRTTRDWILWGVIYLSTALVVFGVTNPHVLLNFAGFVKYWGEAKAFWFDHTNVPASEVPAIWWCNTAIAVGAPTVIASLVGVLFPSRNRLEKFIIIALLISYYLFHGHYLRVRFVASIAPLICLFAARACMKLMRQRWWPLHVAGVSVAVAIVVVSGVNIALGINSRYADSRTRAARWLKTNLAPGSTIGVAEVYPGRIGWETPRLDNLGLKIESPLDWPDTIVMSSVAFTLMRERLHSPKLENWSWNPEHKIDWWDYSPPSPEVIKMFDAIINEKGAYRLSVDFAPTDGYPRTSLVSPPDFSVGIRIYRRIEGGLR